jgi:hypothetical protein
MHVADSPCSKSCASAEAGKRNEKSSILALKIPNGFWLPVASENISNISSMMVGSKQK